MSGADKSDCASWCVLPADHDGPCHIDNHSSFGFTTQQATDFLSRIGFVALTIACVLLVGKAILAAF